MFLGLFFTVGSIVIKTAGLASVIPVDVTLLGAAILAVLTAHQVFSGRYPLQLLAPISALAIFFLVHILFFSESGAQSVDQISKFYFLTLPIVFVVAGPVASQLGIRILLQALLASAGLALAASIATDRGLFLEIGRFTIGDNNNAGTLGYYSAIGVVLCLSRLIMGSAQSKRSPTATAGLVALSLVFGLFVLNSASRGAVFGTSIAVAVLLLLSPGRSRLRLVLLGIAAIPVLRYGFLALSSAARDRLVLEDGSRTFAWQQTFEAFKSSPISGVGFTGVEEAIYPLDYPHNLLLEVAAAGGIFAAAILLWAFAAAFRRAWLGRIHPDVVAIGAIFGLVLFGSMVSLDINNRLLWITCATLLVVPYWIGAAHHSPPRTIENGHELGSPTAAARAAPKLGHIK